MDARWRRYLKWHVGVLTLAAGFAGYALLTRLLFPDGFFHCVLHDFLHLYCPFCGGTRAFLALLRADVREAFRMNGAVLLAALCCVVLDIRALVLLCRKSSKPVLPPYIGRLAVLYFAVYTLALNTAMLYGLDPAGDLAAYWQGRISTWRAACFLPLALCAVVTFFAATDVLPLPQKSRLRADSAFLSGYFLVTLLYILYAHWLTLLLYIPLTAGLLCYLFLTKKKYR